MKKVLIAPTLGLDLDGMSSVIYNYTKAMDRSGLQLSFLTYGDLKPSVRQRFEALGEILFVSDRKQSTKAYVKDYIALLKKHPKKGFLSGIRANRKLLRAFFFWEIATLSIIHISCLGMQAIMMPLILIPVPGILLISAFTQLNDKPPRAGGILCLLAMVPVTVWLCTTGPMALYKLYFLLIMLGGYVMFFLLQLIYHADRFKKTT